MQLTNCFGGAVVAYGTAVIINNPLIFQARKDYNGYTLAYIGYRDKI